MARILVGSYMVRYPLGGMLSWALQWLVGFERLGHEVYLVERADYADACFDPSRGSMGDDGTYGMRVVADLLAGHGLRDRWCFVDRSGQYHGLARRRVADLFRGADLFVDTGTHGAWMEEAACSAQTVLVDGEPGYTQMRLATAMAEGAALPRYDRYYTNGANVGTRRSTAPDAGQPWRHVYNPVAMDLFGCPPGDPSSPYTTVMNWRSHEPLRYDGATYGQKDLELERFLDLPGRVDASMAVAVAGDAPGDRLTAAGWRVTSAHAATRSVDAYRDYICRSKAEFSVCKQVFVATNSGWFSDRSAAYLASGRPVVLQDTGFSAHLPCGRGLFAVRDVRQAAAAIDEIDRDYERHARWARELAAEHLATDKVLGRFLGELGV